MALLILALLQRIFLMSSLMLLLVWLIFFMVLIKLLPILGTISGKTVVFFCVSKNVSVSCAYTQGKREQFSGFNRTLDAINNVFRKFSAFHDETGRLNV